MIEVYILALSVTLQFVAAYLAIRLISITGRRIAWSLVSAALLLMAVRRIIPLIRILSGDAGIRADLTAEIIALVISVLMFAGIAMIGSIFMERKKAEAVLQLAEENFRRSLNESPLGARIVTEKGETIYANRTILDLYGYEDIEEFRTTPTKERYTAESYAAFLDRRRKRHQGEPLPADYEIDIIRKNGEVRHLHVFRKEVLWDGEQHIQTLYLDITERKRREEELSLHATRTQALLDLHLMMNESQPAILDYVLDAMQKACLSEFSFIGLMDETESIMTLHAWSKDTMAQCASVDKPTHFPISEAGVWGDCVRQRKPVTINDYEAPRTSKKGYPEGHVPIRRFLSVPVFDGKKIVAVAAVANKKEPYMEDDGAALISLLNKLWDILRHKHAVAVLKHREDLLQKIFDVLPIGLWLADKDGNLLRGNPAMVNIWGAEPKVSASGYGVFKARRLPSGEEIAPGDSALAHTIREGVTIADEMLEIDAFDGKKKIILNYTAPVLDENGAIQGAIVANLDITGRKQAEEELFLKNLVFDSSLAANSIADTHGKIIQANRSFLRIWGYQNTDEVIGKPIPDFLQYRDEAMVIITALDGTGTWEGEFTAKKQDGSTFIAYTQATIIKHARGKMIGYQSAVIDVSERKIAEEHLARTAWEWQTTFDAVNSAIWILDKDQRVQRSNSAAERIFGRPMEAFIGKRCWEIVHGTNQPIPECPILRAKHSLCRETMELQIGDARFEVAVDPILSADGRYAGAVHIVTDITDRKQAEEALKQSEAKFRNLFDNALEGVYQSTPEGRLITANMAFARMFGYESPEEASNTITSIAYQMYANPNDRKIAVGIFREKGCIEDFECRMRRKDGSIFWARYDGRLTKTQDGTPCFQGFIIDITDRKRAEEEIRKINTELEQRVIDRTARLEDLNKELEAFSYSVSHDLRAPLRGIDGFSQALMEDYQDRPLDKTGRRYLERIRKATKNMGSLIDDMLKLSRVSRSEFNRETIDLSRMVLAIADVFRANDSGKTVDMIVREDVFVQGDHRLLQIALTNLLDNAFKFTGRQECPRIEFGTTVKDGELIYYVRDNGVGFDMAYVDKLFGAFQRLHTTEEFAGTGIGLATARRVISRHGGHIWAEGEIGKGATFYFTLA